MQPSVSIIVPIYNVESFLNRCIDSLISQTLQNIEIILVNDGSTDESGKLADQYIGKDSRVKVIHKKNGGASSARNAGLEAAIGEYVGFVDSDDWVDTEMYERLYNAAVQQHAEVSVSGGFRRVNLHGEIQNRPSLLKRSCYEGDQVIDEILLPMLGSDSHAINDISIEMGVTLNIYERKFLNHHRIRFSLQIQDVSEDLIFNIDVLSKVKTVSAVNLPMYYYRLNVQSLSQSIKSDRFERECFLYEFLKVKLKDLGLFHKSDERLRRTFIGRARWCVVKEARDNKQLGIFERMENIKSITKNQLLKEALKDYPISNYSFKLQLMSYSMKYHMVILLFLVSIFRKRV